MSSIAEQVAHCALDLFATLPTKCKPRTFPDGRREWTPLSSVVVVRGHSEEEQIIECVSLATGTKCLSSDLMSQCQGQILHDSHAEVLALRGFNRWLLQELRHQLVNPDYNSPYINKLQQVDKDNQEPQFTLADDSFIYLFTTEAPCGDASMELLALSKRPEDAVPWVVPAPLPSDATPPVLPGRANFGLLGTVRRKPARADAQPSLSKSCTDKLTVKQLTSLLAFPADILLEMTSAAFLKSLVVPEKQYNATGFSRAFRSTGRMKCLPDLDGSKFFDVEILPNDFPSFPFKKDPGQSLVQKASNTSTLWIRAPAQNVNHTTEILLNGVKQGYKQSSPDIRKQSSVCRMQMALLGQKIAAAMGMEGYNDIPQTYRHAKSRPLRRVKIERKRLATQTLGAWIENEGDSDWSF